MDFVGIKKKLKVNDYETDLTKLQRRNNSTPNNISYSISESSDAVAN